MHRVQQQLEDNCKNKLGGLPVKKQAVLLIKEELKHEEKECGRGNCHSIICNRNSCSIDAV